jgi:hypothetical protein
LLTEEQLKELLHQQGITQVDQMLLCLALDGSRPKQLREIRTIAVAAGLTSAKTMNIAAVLARSNGKAINTPSGWELRNDGKAVVERLAGPYVKSAVPVAATGLRSQLTKITNTETLDFVQQAIACYESKLYRAAVVLSWVGAVSLLYDYVVKNKIVEFNTEALRRDAKWKSAKNADDLAAMKEHEFLQVLESISILGKSVKQELESCLKLRNGCGHPNSLKIAEHRVTSHIEILMLNVFVPPFSP